MQMTNSPYMRHRCHVPLPQVRMQMANSPYASPRECLRDVLATEGLRGLARGLGATLARETPGSVVYFTVYEGCKRFLRASLPAVPQPTGSAGGRDGSSSSSSSGQPSQESVAAGAAVAVAAAAGVTGDRGAAAGIGMGAARAAEHGCLASSAPESSMPARTAASTQLLNGLREALIAITSGGLAGCAVRRGLVCVADQACVCSTFLTAVRGACTTGFMYVLGRGSGWAWTYFFGVAVRDMVPCLLIRHMHMQ